MTAAFKSSFQDVLHLLFRLVRRDHENNPTSESINPKPGADGVFVGVTADGVVVTVVPDGVDAEVGVAVSAGGPMAIRAALAFSAWLGWS